MKKIIEINGMTCAHCQARAQKALGDIPGVSAKVDLKKKQATVTFEKDIPDQVFKDALSEAGYEAVSIQEKKGLFG
jgi:copper ion binding protein